MYIFWLHLQLQSLWVTILLHSSNLNVTINSFFPLIRQYLKHSTGGNVPWKEKFSSSLIIQTADTIQQNHIQQISLHNFSRITLYCIAALNKLVPKFKSQWPTQTNTIMASHVKQKERLTWKICVSLWTTLTYKANFLVYLW